ncbi:MAG: outer membrane protein assembly factor BamA [Alphaproteobacteria bacterium]
MCIFYARSVPCTNYCAPTQPSFRSKISCAHAAGIRYAGAADATLAIFILWSLLFIGVDSAYAVPLAKLDNSIEWRVEQINLSGNRLFSADTLRKELLTKERPLYRFWDKRPEFDAVTFENDLERLRRYYEARGYYGTVIDYDLSVDEEDHRVTVDIRVKEGAPIFISQVGIVLAGDLRDVELPALPALPVKRGEVFQETSYQESEKLLREAFLRHGFAHVETTRKAEVNLATRRVRIRYAIAPGPPAVFGQTEIRGTVNVDPTLIRRELSYAAGEKFSSAKLAETRAKLLALNLFSNVRIAPKPTAGKPAIVPMEITVTEKPPREVRVAVGYSTEEEFRGEAQWRHFNWLGGGRQFSIQGKYSSVIASGAAQLVQPHLFAPEAKGVLTFKYDQEDEQTYLRNVTRFAPRIDYRFSTALTGFLGYRVEYDKLSDVTAATERALGGVRREGILSGPTMGLVWNTTDSPFYPKKGEVLSLTLEQAGVIWGGPYRFFKITAEAKKYYEIGWDTVFATRLKLGVGDAIGAAENYPLFERFYAGGENSVRGYGRRRLGPLSASNDPLGGLSLLEGSVELRRPIWRELGGAVFVDFGQVALQPFDASVFNLKFSSGFGLSYNTPVGPARLDIGFPFQKPPGDRPWQIQFSIGSFF